MFREAELNLIEFAKQIDVEVVNIFSESDVEKFSDDNTFPRVGVTYTMESANEVKSGVMHMVYIDKFLKSNGVGGSVDLAVNTCIELVERIVERVENVTFGDIEFKEDAEGESYVLFVPFSIDIAE